MDFSEDREKDIAYSRTVKAGKRIYYLDVKHSRAGDLYLSLTESKKKYSGTPEQPEVSFEKHKIFLYREDLSKFTEALIDVIQYIHENDPSQPSQPDETDHTDKIVDSEPIRLNLEEFE
ncbi:MAG: DUF3276 family protein [Bacteroidales bacterium]|jgi:hypothetical protein|nr:DUF3276 family protein [Bacteroidales bacterium]MDD3166463.1 DUF3276 family protein [Bacteroidales bacterium]MDD4770173.1 DUF3276 family protein [Bacteroidales bacterium]HKL92627.1 DUF3276 family protein [Bacteroidales bacterium]